MAMKAKHAFGSEQNISKALAEGKIDAYDILFLDEKKVGWINKNGEVVIAETDLSGIEAELATKASAKEVDAVEAELANKANAAEVEAQLATKASAEDVQAVEAQIATKADAQEVEEKLSAKADATEVAALETELATKVTAEEVDAKVETAVKAEIEASVEKTKYEITDVPEGTLVDYRESEIRIMVPADAVFTKQSVGAGGDANSYYCTFKTYAPSDDVVGYIEHLGGNVDAEILTDLKTDANGRKYQPTWLGIAKYDEATGTWNYHGKNSAENHYIGWDYQIDWYNADGMMVESDSIRINLSNEDCHFMIEPYYVAQITKDIDTKIEEKVDTVVEEKIETIVEEKIKEVETSYEIVEF